MDNKLYLYPLYKNIHNPSIVSTCIQKPDTIIKIINDGDSISERSDENCDKENCNECGFWIVIAILLIIACSIFYFLYLLFTHKL